jgi:hypothetical protein
MKFTSFAMMVAASMVGASLLVAGCSSGGTTGGTGGQGGPADAGGGGQTGSGGAGSGGAPAGTGGTGQGSGGAVGSGGAPIDTGVTPDTGMPPDTGVRLDCPAGAVICEDFEKYATGATDLTPDWQTYKYGGTTLQVDTSKPFQGSKALHLTAPVGGRKYADIVKQNPLDKELLPVKHFGRVMLWVTALPSTVHWNINQAGGPLASNAQLIGKYSFGGQNGVLSANYTQRAPVGDGLTPLRGGGPEDGDPNPPPVDCGPNATNQRLAVGKWVCWEWMFDAQASRIQLFLDGVEQTQVGARGNCTTTFQGPRVFSKMILGWEQYTSPSDKPQDAWMDNLVVSDQRIGCPPP